MKTTIKIHGRNIEFTDQPPTRAGAYWWGPNKEDFIAPMRVIDCKGVLCDFSTLLPISKFGGLWSAPLVPVTEVERAWRECADYACRSMSRTVMPFAGEAYMDSRARRVVEGLE